MSFIVMQLVYPPTRGENRGGCPVGAVVPGAVVPGALVPVHQNCDGPSGILTIRNIRKDTVRR